MGKLELKNMYLHDSDKEKSTFGEYILEIPPTFNGYIFRKLFRDPIGQSGGNPTWGELYQYEENEMYYICNCVFKEFDYDFPDNSYAEKLWSILGRKVLKDCRVPEITMVNDKRYNEIGVCSHNIIERTIEDPYDIKTILFHKYEREQLNNLRSIVPLKDLIECVRIQVDDEIEFKRVEKQIVDAILLDCMTNNADRHMNNWTLIRDKRADKYTLGLYDHSASFIDMMKDNKGASVDGWTSTYLSIDEKSSRKGIGNLGRDVLKYLVNKYPEISDEFFKNMYKELPSFYEDIQFLSSKVDIVKIKKNFEMKQRYVNKILEERGEERE